MIAHAIIMSGLILAPVVGTAGIVGTGSRIYKYVKKDDSPNSFNNKVQSIATLAMAAAVAVPAFLLGAPVVGAIASGVGLLLNLPHVAKLFVKDETRRRLDNIAGIITGLFNSICIIPYAIAAAGAL